jgi:hypothetical protein
MNDVVNEEVNEEVFFNHFIIHHSLFDIQPSSVPCQGIQG